MRDLVTSLTIYTIWQQETHSTKVHSPVPNLHAWQSTNGKNNFGKLHPRYTQTQIYPNTLHNLLIGLSTSFCPHLIHQYNLCIRSSKSMATPINKYHFNTGNTSQVEFILHKPTACKQPVRPKTIIVVTPRYIGLLLGIRKRLCVMKDELDIKAERSNWCQNKLKVN